MDCAELMTSKLFSWIRKAFSLPLLIALSSIVFGADKFIILLENRKCNIKIVKMTLTILKVQT